MVANIVALKLIYYTLKLKKSDKGSYQCIVKNDVEELSEEVDLVVSKLLSDLIHKLFF